MARSVVTAADIEQAHGGRLVVAPDALVTPLAWDVAKERGVRIERGSAPEAAASVPDDPLMARVRSIVTALLGPGGGGLTTPATTHRVKHASYDAATLARFPYPGPPPDMDVHTGDVVTERDGAPMAAGYMTITKGSFPWTLSYDEIQIVLEGELHIGGDGPDRVGRAGDVLYVPKGSSITFGTPSWAKFVYVTFPADWEAQA